MSLPGSKTITLLFLFTFLLLQVVLAVPISNFLFDGINNSDAGHANKTDQSPSAHKESKPLTASLDKDASLAS
ncbi:MAG: hypothetical protein DHS80DRAFT_31958 [Piptocephalis tieghemiana]|nr:MAG: hypothetical protein DHS80DRAFT_31958 [Piptocephalis tieghemiana]